MAKTKELPVLDEESKFHCPVIDHTVKRPCELHGCLLWVHQPTYFNCTAIYTAKRAANGADRLQSTHGAYKDRPGSLRAAAEGRLSLYDLAFLFGISRQKVEVHVAAGKDVFDVLAPLHAQLYATSSRVRREPQRRLGSAAVFSSVTPVSRRGQDGQHERVCVACESLADAEDTILAVADKQEVAWCSRECAEEFPIDAFLLSTRYRRHWTAVVTEPEQVDERARVREITPERMMALAEMAAEMGFVRQTLDTSLATE